MLAVPASVLRRDLAEPSTEPPSRPARRGWRVAWILVALVVCGIVIAAVSRTLGDAAQDDLLPLQTFDAGTSAFGVDRGGTYADGAYVMHARGGPAGANAELSRASDEVAFSADVVIRGGDGSLFLAAADTGGKESVLFQVDHAWIAVLTGPDGTVLTEVPVEAFEPGTTHRLMLTVDTKGTATGSIDGRVVARGSFVAPGFTVDDVGLAAVGHRFEVAWDNVQAGSALP